MGELSHSVHAAHVEAEIKAIADRNARETVLKYAQTQDNSSEVAAELLSILDLNKEEPQ